MSPVTHFLAGWMLASTAPLMRREKVLVVAAAVAPDIDGLGLLPELLTRNSSHPLLWFSEYHHSLHTLAFAIVCTLAAFLVAGPLANAGSLESMRPSTHPWLTAALVFLSFHLHLLCDLLGARGPDGYQWPIPYLKPFSDVPQLMWRGQWMLNGWQNLALTGVLLLVTFWIAWKRGSSPIELVSERGNQAFIGALRQRFPVRSKA